MPPRPVVLTFDDGFADFHDRALPLLARYGFTATVFVTTGWIADSGAPDAAHRRPGRMLSWSQIAEAAATGVEIGAHSHGHPELDLLAAESLRRELDLQQGPARAAPQAAGARPGVPVRILQRRGPERGPGGGLPVRLRGRQYRTSASTLMPWRCRG